MKPSLEEHYKPHQKPPAGSGRKRKAFDDSTESTKRKKAAALAQGRSLDECLGAAEFIARKDDNVAALGMIRTIRDLKEER